MSSLQFRGLALGGPQLAAKVLRGGLQQPVGVHQTQVPHVAAGRVQQLVEHHVGRLTLEEHGGRVDGHGLVAVQGQVGAVGLQLRRVHKHAVGQAAAHVARLRPARLQLHVELQRKQAERGTRVGSVWRSDKLESALSSELAAQLDLGKKEGFSPVSGQVIFFRRALRLTPN